MGNDAIINDQQKNIITIISKFTKKRKQNNIDANYQQYLQERISLSVLAIFSESVVNSPATKIQLFSYIQHKLSEQN